ncbi:MAG: DUF3995 domain-containing protein [Ilumatobacteraceae bacterium]
MRARTVRTSAGLATAAALATIGVVHVAWGRGSTFPYGSREELNDAVVGRPATPSPAACYAVAGALFTGAAGVARSATSGGLVARLTTAGVAVALTVRGGAGVAGRTDVLVPGSASPAFRRLDRRVLGPLCLALGAGAAAALGR